MEANNQETHQPISTSPTTDVSQPPHQAEDITHQPILSSPSTADASQPPHQAEEITHQPILSSPATDDASHPTHQQEETTHPPILSSPAADDVSHPTHQQEEITHQPILSSPPVDDAAQEPHQSPAPPQAEEKKTNKKWGTYVMGPPAAPTVHPDNQKAATWNADEHQQMSELPYIQYTPIEKSSHNPLEPVINMFNTWSKKTESVARNVWNHLTTGPSMPETAWGKVTVTAKAITEGGFESLFKQIFDSEPNEKLKKTFACYLSSSTGPVAGTIYLSTARVGFCSDRPLCYTAPSGQEAWSYYKVIVPLVKISNVNPVVMREEPPEKYIQIVTIDGHEFWFMGLVSYEKALHNLLESVSNATTEIPAPAPAPAPTPSPSPAPAPADV